ncbi:glutamate receptor ionotropic, kainate 2 isoform X2 [Ceratitis capitata]|uniref:glutamate receptor ionotropic, kainate 2 isoform X2 n=1 Tax=Ceratitis capitata TaxID=7213 RepID=UPI000329C6EB|nr:glutamate receptor ionotropic, kainate 2 isoform X2 [Ceratitis capitata]
MIMLLINVIYFQLLKALNFVYITLPKIIKNGTEKAIEFTWIEVISKTECNCVLYYFNRRFAIKYYTLTSRKVSTSHFLLLYFLSNILCAAALPPVIRLEDQRDSSVEFSFKYAVYRINKDKLLLSNTQLIYDIEYVPRDDSFRTTKKVCRQLELGVNAIFGPSDPLLAAHVQSICESFDIPHIESRIDYKASIKEFSINLYPSQRLMNLAHRDLMVFLNWTKTAIIYEDDFGLFNQQDLIRATTDLKIEIYIRQASPETYRRVLRAIRQKEIYKIIVDTNPAYINSFFRTILQLQMNDYRYHYMFTTFDLETFDLEDFKYNGVNITAFRLVDVKSQRYEEVIEQMMKLPHSGLEYINGQPYIQTQSALMFDSVYTFAAGLTELDRSHLLRFHNISCSNDMSWNDGLSLYNYINSVSIHGLTGHVSFVEGYRNRFQIDLLKLKHKKIEKVGIWKPDVGVNITDPTAFYEIHTSNTTLIVMTREEKPYVMVRNEGNQIGNSRFEGFCIDLLEAIATQVGFHYKIELVPDNMYGVYNPDSNSWNGIVRELMERRADLAVASMTINYARESVIDFTKPFMNLGIGILFKVPTSQPTRLFSFMNPLAMEIWLYVLGAYVLVSFTLFVMARFSPYEWNNPHPCLIDSDIVENQFSVSNSFWFITGTFLRQGSGLNPKATSTRIVGGIWWFFTLIIISSYTANLAAFLTVERMITPIESASDLADQTDISYGTLEGGSTMTFFRDSKIDIYRKMWEYMEKRRSSVFVKTYEEGIKHVLEGNYAFLMESTMLDYAVQRDCNLTQIGGLLDSKGYGIATPKGSIWRDPMSLAILELQEKGIIQILYDKWWKNTGDVCNRDEKSKESKANALGIENIGGVFVVLLCGLALAVVVAILEFCWHSKKTVQLTENQSLCSEMAEELRYAIHCHASKKRPSLKRICVKCTPDSTYVPVNLGSGTPNISGVHYNFFN